MEILPLVLMAPISAFHSSLQLVGKRVTEFPCENEIFMEKQISSLKQSVGYLTVGKQFCIVGLSESVQLAWLWL